MPKPYVTPPVRHEFFGILHQFVPLASGAVASVDSVQIDGQADFLIYTQAAMFSVTGEAKLNFQIQSDKLLMDVPAFGTALGAGWNPLILASPFRIPRSSAFNAIAWDRAAAPGAQNVRILHAGLKEFDRPFEPARAYHTIQPFTYWANLTADDGGGGTVGALATKQFANVVSGEYDFDIYKMIAVADGDATLQVETSGKALTWFNRACPLTLLGFNLPTAALNSNANVALVGVQPTPFRLPRPVHVPAAGAIITVVTDLSNATNRVQIGYHGLRLYPAGGIPIDEGTAARLMQRGI